MPAVLTQRGLQLGISISGLSLHSAFDRWGTNGEEEEGRALTWHGLMWQQNRVL